MPCKAIYQRRWNYEEQAFSCRRLKLLLCARAHTPITGAYIPMAEDSIPYGASHDDNGNRVCTPLWFELAIVRVRRLENDSGEGTARIIIVLEFSFMDLLHERVASWYRSIREALFFYLGIKEKESRK